MSKRNGKIVDGNVLHECGEQLTETRDRPSNVLEFESLDVVWQIRYLLVAKRFICIITREIKILKALELVCVNLFENGW